MSNGVKDINQLKHQVKELIKDNLYRKVTPDTKYKTSGIYMIYIDHFTNEEVVPIYIGQSKDIQRRYKQHYLEILALNRLSYDEYKKYFFSKVFSFYEGNFKSCKIFKYMLENNCTLQDFHMIILDEINEEKLEDKELEYFRRLMPSFFGFNQFNSFLKSLPFRFSNTQMNEVEINDYLDLIIEDIQGIHVYYDYGFTKFNFEHSMPTPKGIDYLLQGKKQWSKDTLLKFEKVNSELYDLYKQYKPDYEEMRPMIDKKEELYGDYVLARLAYGSALEGFKNDVNKEFREQKLYSEKAKENFINSVIDEDKRDYKENFKDYLKSRNCEADFYRTFQNQIDTVKKKYENMTQIKKPYQKIEDIIWDIEVNNRSERYKMIFPAFEFNPFALSDNIKSVDMEIILDDNLFNSCHIKIYISNNAISRNDIRKDPDIIRIDYCYINDEGQKHASQHYIDNETTINCKSENKYYEQDFYSMFAFRPEKFKITRLIDNEQDNSFISILAEYKHGINDYTIKDKKLIKLESVLEEIIDLTNGETRFNVDVSESYRCLEKCMINEGVQDNELAQNILTKKLLKIRKRVGESSVAKAKKVVGNSGEQKSDKTALRENNKIKRQEKYKQKVSQRSNNAINILKYVSSKEKVTARCNSCGHERMIRSDHLLARPYCPKCR